MPSHSSLVNVLITLFCKTTQTLIPAVLIACQIQNYLLLPLYNHIRLKLKLGTSYGSDHVVLQITSMIYKHATESKSN